MISSFRRLPPRILANFKIQKCLFSLNASFMKEKNDKESVNAHSLVTSICSTVMVLPVIKEIIEEMMKMSKEYMEKLEEKNQEILKMSKECTEKFEAKNAQLETKNKEHIQQLEAKNKEHVQQLEAKNKEHVQQLEAKNTQLEAKNKEYVQQLEAKNKEHNEEVDKLKEKQKDDALDFFLRSQELVRLQRVCNVRAALEYVRSCISSKKGEDTLLYEPVDKVLERLSNDQRFKEYLIKTCEKNQVNIEAVKKCISGLCHTSSKELHGYDKVVIFEKDWAVNEIIALGLIFKYYGIPFEYMNANEQLVKFSYKLALR
ncbi:histidine-rich protein [Gigaspora margarita]|uniref:Histidine-rich protein n=1 Tax=Gigaspora margarita TaxID=4874 RepID=A0A8H3WZH3_GIGMA|nr:histidine-rich protein [Gigaspora margarita]